MEKRFVIFLVLAVALILGNTFIMQWLRSRNQPPEAAVGQLDPAQENGPAGNPTTPNDVAADPSENGEPTAPAGTDAQAGGPAQPNEAGSPQAEDNDGQGGVEGAEAGNGTAAAADEPPKVGVDTQAEGPVADAEPQEQTPETWVTLGSLDPESRFRMLVTLTSEGGALARAELNQPKYLDTTTVAGYMGYLAAKDAENGRGSLVQAVGSGTPAAKAGLQPGDIIAQLNATPITNAADLDTALAATEAGQTVELNILRGGETLSVSFPLVRTPLAVVRRDEGTHDPFSLLLTLHQIGDDRIVNAARVPPEGLPREVPETVEAEMPGLNLRHDHWQLVQSGEQSAEFVFPLPDKGLELVKRYTLAQVQQGIDLNDEDAPMYHLVFEVEIRNRADGNRTVAYQLDGPTGLPDEGWWYANKIGRTWGGSAALRDVACGFARQGGTEHVQTSSLSLAAPEEPPNFPGDSLDYIGVDAQFFCAILLPMRVDPTSEVWFAQSRALRVGQVPELSYARKRVNTTCRLISEPVSIKPGEKLTHHYRLFMGPKRPELLAHYNSLGELVYYGWFGFTARPLTAVLHFFHWLVPNYAIAIVMLTVVVRLCMFPLSRKQTLNALRMQELQPEMKRISDKYKGDAQARGAAMQELFRKHNYNPLAGCLPMFVQLPIFIGLYRSLAVDVELRQEPLIPGLNWCSNLSAPDMVFNWSNFMPDFLEGWLGPYFNLLPCITVALFLVQQKMLMPPPADEQAEMQQKMMKYMMVFIGVMFFKVASGLCIYFIASSLWGLAERKLLPKPKLAPATSIPAGERKPGLLQKILEKADEISKQNGSNGAGRAKKRSDT